jgi:hypothetical protein
MIYGKELTNDKTDEFEAMLLAAQEERTSDACLNGETGEAKDEDSSSTKNTHGYIRTHSPFSVTIHPYCALHPGCVLLIGLCMPVCASG